MYFLFYIIPLKRPPPLVVCARSLRMRHANGAGPNEIDC